MNRRSLVRTLATFTFGTAIAGCTETIEDTQEDLQSDLRVYAMDAETTAFGNIVMAVGVENRGSARGSEMLWGEVDIEGGDTYQKSQQISVGPQESKRFEFDFDIDLSESLSGSSYSYDAWVN